MELNQRLVDGLDLALNESRVCGLHFDPPSGMAQLLLEVVALPEVGPIDPDPRRVFLLAGVSRIEVVLRHEQGQVSGPVIPLDSLEDLELFFASLTQADAMYGWSFIDIAEPSDDWDVTPSLSLAGEGSPTSDHTLHWFTECGRPGPDDSWDSFALHGVVHFAELSVERADSSPVPVDEFIADASRWWRAFEAHDDRLSTDAQQRLQSNSPSWRSWGGTSVMVPGKPS